jgi:hypothetical protein
MQVGSIDEDDRHRLAYQPMHHRGIQLLTLSVQMRITEQAVHRGPTIEAENIIKRIPSGAPRSNLSRHRGHV